MVLRSALRTPQDDNTEGGARTLSFFRGLDCWSHHRSSYGHDCSLRGVGGGVSAGQDLLLDVLYEFLDLALHFFHAFAHLQNDCHTRDVDAEIAGEGENE